MSAIGLFIELNGDIGLFDNAKKLSVFWGTHPILKDSGDGSMVPKMSKNGRSLPRSILFMIVLNGIQCSGFISDTYKRQSEKRKEREQSQSEQVTISEIKSSPLAVRT